MHVTEMFARWELCLIYHIRKKHLSFQVISCCRKPFRLKHSIFFVKFRYQSQLQNWLYSRLVHALCCIENHCRPQHFLFEFPHSGSIFTPRILFSQNSLDRSWLEGSHFSPANIEQHNTNKNPSKSGIIQHTFSPWNCYL